MSLSPLESVHLRQIINRRVTASMYHRAAAPPQQCHRTVPPKADHEGCRSDAQTPRPRRRFRRSRLTWGAGGPGGGVWLRSITSIAYLTRCIHTSASPNTRIRISAGRRMARGQLWDKGQGVASHRRSRWLHLPTPAARPRLVGRSRTNLFELNLQRIVGASPSSGFY